MKHFAFTTGFSRINQQRGFSIMEALLTLAVTSFGLIAVAKFQGVTLLSSGQAKARTEAVALAEREIEQLRNYASLADFDNGIGTTTTNRDGQNSSFTITRTVVGNVNPTYKQLTAAVTWTDSTGPQSVELTSFIQRSDPLNSGKIMLAAAGGGNGSVSGGGGNGDDDYTDNGDDDPNGDGSDPDDQGDPDSDKNESGDNGNDDGYGDETGDVYDNSNYIYIEISGSITSMNQNAHVSDVYANGNYALDCVFTDAYYVCESGPIPIGESWGGQVTLQSNKTVCGSGTVSYQGITGSETYNYTIAKAAKYCP